MNKSKGGAQKARERRDKQERREAELKKISKISSFFATTKSGPEGPDAGEENDSVQPPTDSVTVSAASVESNDLTIELQIGPLQESESVDVHEMETSGQDQVTEAEQDTSMPMPPGAVGDDLGKWVREDINEQSRCFWITKGSSTCQHLDGPFDNSITVDGKVKRSCTRSVFTRVHNLTRNQTLRNWLCYSSSKGALFCFTCFLLSKTSNGQFALDSVTGSMLRDLFPDTRPARSTWKLSEPCWCVHTQKAGLTANLQSNLKSLSDTGEMF